MTPRFRKILLVLGLLFAAGFTYAAFQSISHHGKTAVKLVVIPDDSAVKVDGRASSAGNIYVKPGLHSFVADKAGFKTSSQQIRITDQRITVNLLPEPESAEALQWIKDHPDAQLQKQTIGDAAASALNTELISENPILQKLPLGYGQQEFAIDYKQADKDPTRIILLITGKTALSRQFALRQIREWGYDPTDYEIDFLDFKNPLGASQ